MYKYDERTGDMYRQPKFGKTIREHLKWVDIKKWGETGQKLTIRAEGFNGNQCSFATNGHMTIKDIVDSIVKGLHL